MRAHGRTIVLAGLVGGALDLAFALIYAGSKGTGPSKLLQIVGSGLLGERAFEMGLTSAAVGVGAHFALSVSWAAVFAMMARERGGNPWVLGPLFGSAVLLLMRLVVLPLSAYPYPMNFAMPGTLYDLLSHMFLFGLPIALILTRRQRAG